MTAFGKPQGARGLQAGMKLTPEDREKLQAWVAQHGYEGAARRLGVGPTLIDKLVGGGCSTLASVERMTQALRTVAMIPGIKTAKKKGMEP